ncbi:hypothetical protein AC062_1821 [Pasteurellaceae bacterium NI1060]|nr:hypothetical protein AC062_1821 [Pasteurellaceae bacterium NI1060]
MYDGRQRDVPTYEIKFRFLQLLHNIANLTEKPTALLLINGK